VTTNTYDRTDLLSSYRALADLAELRIPASR